MASVCAVFGMMCSLMSLVLNALAIATPHWLHSRSMLPTLNIGLFRHCEVEDNFCGDMERINAMINPSDIAWFRVIQAAFILSVIGSLLSSIMSVFLLTKLFDGVGGYKMTSLVNFLTMTSEITVVVLFGLNYVDMFGLDGHTVSLEWSYYVAIAACVFLFFALVFHAMEASRAAEIIKNVQHRITGLTTPYTLFVDQEP
ncbi:hypothetical protein SNE40_021723 [Patella caerulea]|uniref:Transmembrane protein n=2 Tax=Patella caerulea TaxID=87958 RepID=A0AAN8G8J0_PATCE